MPPKNDALKSAYITWSTKEDDVIGKIKSSKLSDDGFTFTAELDLNSIITFPKEKMMNKNEKLKDVNCICMFKDGDEVKAVAMRNVHNVLLEGSNLFTDYGSGSKVVASASAKCNPDDIFDFNIGAKLALDRLYEGYDMTPKPKNLYSGKIALINTKQEVTKYVRGIVIYNVIDGTIPELCLLTSSKDLRIEKNMTCSDLYKRVADMYFHYSTWFDKVMYVGGFGL